MSTIFCLNYITRSPGQLSKKDCTCCGQVQSNTSGFDWKLQMGITNNKIQKAWNMGFVFTYSIKTLQSEQRDVTNPIESRKKPTTAAFISIFSWNSFTKACLIDDGVPPSILIQPTFFFCNKLIIRGQLWWWTVDYYLYEHQIYLRKMAILSYLQEETDVSHQSWADGEQISRICSLPEKCGWEHTWSTICVKSFIKSRTKT